jgi:hypothetical protein
MFPKCEGLYAGIFLQKLILMLTAFWNLNHSASPIGEHLLKREQENALSFFCAQNYQKLKKYLY